MAKRRPNIGLIKKTIKEMGGKIEALIPERDLYLVRFGKKTFPIERKFYLSSGILSEGRFTKDKDFTYQLLRNEKISTPKSIFFYNPDLDKERSGEKLKKLNYPIFIKEISGSNSLNIFPNIDKPNKALNIVKKELKLGRRVLAQEMVFGKEYRILVLDKKVIGALEMVPPHVFGDGVSDIKDLIKKKQRMTRKKTQFDSVLKAVLKRQELDLKSIPKKGKFVFIKDHSSLAEGGARKDVTNNVHSDFIKICSKAAKIVGKNLAGIDLICEDITKHIVGQKYYILEINGMPDIYIHYGPDQGETQNVIKEIIKFILKNI